MAVIHQRDHNGRRYEVRTAGNSIRLYTDGIFHSQWNPKRALAGHLWDLLFLPSIMIGRPKNALVLGVGGGAIINSLQFFYSDIAIDAVDIDSHHLEIAEQYFVENASAKIRYATSCAREFIRYPQKYDYVLEDLFDGRQGDARRAISLDKDWLSSLWRCVSAKGVLVVNLEDHRQERHVLAMLRKQNTIRPSTVFTFTHPRYENHILVLTRKPVTRENFDHALLELHHAHGGVHTKSLVFNLKKPVWP